MAEGGPTPPDLETQKNEINALLKKVMKKGDIWYLIDNRWFKQWKKYVGCDSWDTGSIGEQSTHPGPIDNTPLFKVTKNKCSKVEKDVAPTSDSPILGGLDSEDEVEEISDEIKDHLIDELDYILSPEEAWDLLLSWYGQVDGLKPIARNVVEYGMFVKHCKVEVYLMDFKLCQNSDLDNFMIRKFSKADTIGFIEQEMRTLFEIPEEKETRLWNRYTTNTYEHLNKRDSTVQDAGLYQLQVLVIEQKNDDGTWPRQLKCTVYQTFGASSASGAGDGKQFGSSSNMSTRYGSGSVSTIYNSSYNSFSEGNPGNVHPGLCGLSNLGNTCFMNSALQCMSNCTPLTKYFLDDEYWNEMNTENPLGMRGEIAKSYGELIKAMWSGRFTYTVPRNFKMQVGRFAPQFSGYQQQDSQELMAFLLDGLHEDLNRIKQKPYIELRDAVGRPDEEVAMEAWNNYRKRNDSIIVDIFHGLLKSTLVCPECDKISVTFDPFCYLTLPMPIKKERQIDAFFIPLDPMHKPVQLKLTVPKLGNMGDLCLALNRLIDKPANKMIVTDVYNNRFHKIYVADEGVNNILDRDDIFVYETAVLSRDDAETIILPVYMREKRLKPGHNNYSSAQSHLFGQPLLVHVLRAETTYEMLYKTILQRMARYVAVPEPSDEWWLEPENGEGINGEVEMANGDEDYESDTLPYEDTKETGNATNDSDNHMNHDGSATPENQHRIRNSMFTMTFVNSYGNSDVGKLKNNNQSIKFSSRAYVAIDWHPKAKEKFYDEKKAEEFEQHESMHFKTSTKKQVIQLGECLELFTATEKLSAEDSWYCPSCKKHQQATKKFDLWSLPKILILCFKRFSYNRYWRDKIDTLVEFPNENLNMAKYIINALHRPAVYDLIAVSNHYGGMGGGHYTAYAKNKDDCQWYYFDDSNVSSSTEDNVVSKAAYVLFYMRRDPSDTNLSNQKPRKPATATNSSATATSCTVTTDTQDNGGRDREEEDMETN